MVRKEDKASSSDANKLKKNKRTSVAVMVLTPLLVLALCLSIMTLVSSKKFIEKFGIDTSTYDVIKGWRANASYFYIAKEFVRDNVDTDILEELLSLGGLGIQYCIKSELAYSKLTENKEGLIRVEYSVFNDKYNQRDVRARENMHDLIESDANKVTNVFSTLF